MADTVWIGGVDVQTLADIVSLEGVLMTGPHRGDLIEFDFADGATWVPGPAAAYSYELPLLMASDDPDVALEQLRTVQAWADGTVRTVQRDITVDGVLVSEEHQGVIASATEVSWSFDARNLVGCVLIVQNLDGGWSAVVP